MKLRIIKIIKQAKRGMISFEEMEWHIARILKEEKK